MDLNLIKKIKEFKKKFFYGTVTNLPGETKGGKRTPDIIKWSYQHLPDDGRGLQYWPAKPLRELTVEDLTNHFGQRAIKLNGSWKGSIASVGKFQDNKTMWFIIDCDSQEAVDRVRDNILPVYDRYKIEYIWEFSGTAEVEKAHLWFMCKEVDVTVLDLFVKQIFKEANTDIKGLELFPTGKSNNVIRLPGGVHLKTRNPTGEFKVHSILYKGIIDSKAEFILDSFIAAKQVTEEEIRKVLHMLPKEGETTTTTTLRKSGKFHYHSRNLPLPTENLPKVIKKVASNCQAINRILTECMDQESNLLADKLGLGHSAGLWLWRLAMYNDARSNYNKNIKCNEGEVWIRDFIEKNRMTPYDAHNWGRDREEVMDNPERYFPKCETWEKTFDYCTGCPFKDRPGFTNPRQIWYGKPIIKHKIKDVTLMSAENSRTDTFKRAGARIKECLESGVPKDILLASFQGSGKSFFVDEITTELAKSGKKILIAVPTADLAIEHKKRIETDINGNATGVKAFVAMSHANLFKKMNPGFDCPEETEINRLYKLGASSGTWKNTFCKKCPFANECPYPNQYKSIVEDNHDVVIIQHAHFTCRETLFSIMQNRYDVMFVDEAFIDNTYKIVKPKQIELEILDTFALEIPWAQPLKTWLENGGYAKQDKDTSTLRPTETQLELIKFKMDDMRCPWNIPDYLRYYNLNMYYDKIQGFQIFYPIPSSPSVTVRVFTDATPPVAYLKTVLDNENIEIFGEDEILDYRLLNPENKIYQVLDCSASKTSLKGEISEEDGEYNYERFIQILQMIGDKARNEYKGKKILITTYADGERDQFKTVAMNYLSRSYPDLEVGLEPPSQICISHMMVGTNKFEDYEVQFLLAGVYMNALQLRQAVFKLKSISNFWNRLRDRPLEPNTYPYGVSETSTVERKEVEVRRVLPVGNKGAEFELEGFKNWLPEDPDQRIIEKFAIAKTQQAIRLRFNDGRLRIVYIFSNMFLKTFLVTNNFIEDELLGYLRDKDSKFIVT